MPKTRDDHQSKFPPKPRCSRGYLPHSDQPDAGETPAVPATPLACCWIEAGIETVGYFQGVRRAVAEICYHSWQFSGNFAIARDAGVSRSTVQNHFEILVDTLIGFWLPAWKLKSSTKQVQKSKIFFFDLGVVRALTGRQAYPATSEELGPLLETLVLQELRAFLSYTGREYPLYFWRTYDGTEVDFLFETQDGFVAIEVKSTKRWDKRFHRGLRRLRSELGVERTRCFGLYLGENSALWDDVQVMPVIEFLRRLWGEEIAR